MQLNLVKWSEPPLVSRQGIQSATTFHTQHLPNHLLCFMTELIARTVSTEASCGLQTLQGACAVLVASCRDVFDDIEVISGWGLMAGGLTESPGVTS